MRVVDSDLVALAHARFRFDAVEDDDSLLFETVLNEGRDVRILLCQKTGASIQDGDLHPEARKSLGQLATDRSATENDQTLRRAF